MAMAAAMLVWMPSTGAILSASSGPVAENLSGMRSKIDLGSGGNFQLWCNTSDFCARAPESGSGHDGGAYGGSTTALCFGGIFGSSVMSSRNARFRYFVEAWEAGTRRQGKESVPRLVAQAGVGFANVIDSGIIPLEITLFNRYLCSGESSTGADKDSCSSLGKPKSSDDALEEARRIMDKYK